MTKMMMTLARCAGAALSLTLLVASASSQAPSPVAIKAARLIVGDGTVIENPVVIVTGDQITASTTPRLGYTVSKESGNGGTAITVEFQSSGSESKLVGQCSRGTPTATVEEKGPGGD